jgi:exodeoxyribonuclease V alpha subunit
VLRDLKESGVIPFTELTKIVRSDGGGRVVRACHALKDGRVPEPGTEISLPTENWVHLERSIPAEIGDTIVVLYESIRNNGNYDPYWDVQVISPQIRTDGIGCEPLNQRLSDLLNPRREGYGQESPGFTPDFRVGDKVVRTKNGVVDLLSPYRPFIDERVDCRWDGKEWSISEVDVVNGDMGTVVAIEVGAKESHVVVQFRTPERLCRLPYSDPNIIPAFAMTVHKAQGSGFPVVITPVSLLFHWNPRTETGLNSLENFYTNISRTEKILFTVGQWAAVEAITRRRTIHHRRTLLAGRLREAFTRIASGYEDSSHAEGERAQEGRTEAARDRADHDCPAF